MPEDDHAPLPEIKASELAKYYGVRWFHLWLLITAITIMSVAGAVAGATPYVLTAIQTEFHVSDSQIGLVGSSLLLGSIAGVLLCGRTSDVIGRRLTLMICLSAMVVISLCHLAIPTRGMTTPGFLALIILRMLTGIPYGATYCCTVPLVVEFLPDFARGSFVVLMGMGFNVGTLYLLTCMPVLADVVPWRHCFAFGPVMPAATALLLLLCIPESPRWLLTRGRMVEAEHSLSVMFASHPIIGTAFVGSVPKVDTTDLQDLGTYAIAEQSTLKVVKLLLSTSLWRVTVVSISLYFLNAGASNTAWTWGPEFLTRKLGFSPSELSAVFKITEISSISGLLVTVLIVDQFSRITLLSALYVLAALSLTLMAVGTGLGPKSAEVGWILLNTVKIPLWHVLESYVSEAFPTVLRGTATGLVIFPGRVASVAFPMLAGIWIHDSPQTIIAALITMYSFGALISLMIPKETSSHPMDDALVIDDAACIPLRLAMGNAKSP